MTLASPECELERQTDFRRCDTTPLPAGDDSAMILIRESTASNEPEPMAQARAAALAALQRGQPAPSDHPIVERTLAKLAKVRGNSDGLVRSKGPTFVHVALRPQHVERSGTLLRALVAAAAQAGIQLVKRDSGATWLCDGERISFELVDAADQVPHVATDKELAAVAAWKREREDRHRRYRYWSDWGEPKIPKWEQCYRGRLSIKLEQVRIQSERSPWGEAIMGTFADTRLRDVTLSIPRIVSTIAAMAAAKKSNREFEARRRAAEQEAARRRVEAERRRAHEEEARGMLVALADEQCRLAKIDALLQALKRAAPGERLGRFLSWATDHRDGLEQRLRGSELELRFEEAGLFESAGEDCG